MKPLRILIVDDHPLNLKLLRAQLEAEGHTILDAPNGAVALQVLEHEPIEAIVSDILMPVMDGYRLCYEVRHDPRFQHLPFIAYTASYVSSSDEKLSLDLGADRYLRKPASVEDLVRTIGDAISSPGHQPVATMDTTEVLKEYSERLVDKLEERNVQLREANGQLRELLDHSPAVLYALKLEGETVVLRLSGGNITGLLGFPADQTLSREWWLDHLHPSDRALAEASIAETLSHGVSRTEYRLRHCDGTYRWVDDNRRLVRDAAGTPGDLVGVWTDITVRRSAIDELAESERRFRSMLNNLELVSVMLDCDARVTFCNDYFLKLTGWVCDEVIGRDWFDLLVPSDSEADLRAAFALLLTDTPEAWHHTNEILTRSGRRRLIQWNNTVLRSSADVVIGVASVGEDVTSRTEAERQRRRSEEQLQIIVRASTDAMWEWNIATGEGFWSDRAYDMLGYRRETFQPTMQTFGAIVHPDDFGLFQEANREYLTQEEPHGVRFRLRHGDGSFIPVLARGQLQRETGRVVGVFTDLSAVERAETQIREQAALLDQAHDGIAVRGLDDRITFWSKGAERLYGWSRSEAMGRRLNDLLHIDAAGFMAGAKAVRNDGVWSGEVEKTTAAGQPVVVDCSWTLLRDDDGQPKAIFSIDTNITNRKTMERQSFRAQRLESLGTLAGGIAHDLNNLLMPILMGVTLLKRLEPGERSLKAILNIEQSVKRGTDLVKQVLLFARGVEGTRTAIDLARIVAEVEAIAGSTFPKNISFATDIPGTSKVIGDSTQLNQVLLNLCVNARDAMPDGGQITISARNAEINHQYAVMHGGANAGHYVVLEVTDSGSGIPKEVLERVFEPFFTTKEVGKGTGLGLSTVQGIVRSHGGFIEVSSTIGKGSTFQVYLPAHSGPAAARTESEVEEFPRGRGEVILVVDDEPAILSIAKQTLEEFGYIVLTAEHGAQAIAIYARDHARIAVVLTDMMMPIVDGAALIAALRGINPVVSVIAMSGYTEPEQEARVTKAGGVYFLSKPYSAEVMLRTLSMVLGRAAATVA
jgi:PAS domain S-box-containing protein